ncbi:MAG TPA: NUDIX hydrolase [Candidatus Hydrogenedentes bacterium]|nr:NUDIX hydrolase [Candidatus Hydrogenedentota bacterium]HIJ73173.1 NUDIX hydrolase [Candidatus Hydrogenedentota bacterium]
MPLEGPRVRIAAIIVRRDALLLVRHVKEGKTYWLLPGGGVHFGETLCEALEREVREETGLEIRPGALVFANDSIPPQKERHVLNLYFTAAISGGELVLGEDVRLAELRFVPIDELSSLAFRPDIRAALIPALREGFPGRAVYLGNLWRDD